MYKQIIIARKDLRMSSGKLAAQVSHASMAFITNVIRKNAKEKMDCNVGYTYKKSSLLTPFKDDMIETSYIRKDLYAWANEARERGDKCFYFEPVNKDEPYGELRLCEKKYHIESTISFDLDLYNEWVNGTFTKIILQAKNKAQLEKAIILSNEIGLSEGEDYFLIRDNCYTELNPEDKDGRTLTCIGFRPMEDVVIDKIGKKYQLWKD